MGFKTTLLDRAWLNLDFEAKVPELLQLQYSFQSFILFFLDFFILF